MLMRNFDKIAIKLTRARIFLKKHIVKMRFIFINFKVIQIDGCQKKHARAQINCWAISGSLITQPTGMPRPGRAGSKIACGYCT